MIGTDWEILLYASYTSLADKWELSHNRLLVMRKYINKHKLSVSIRTDMLNKIGAKQLRPSYTLQGIIKDRYGRIFTEESFIRMFINENKDDRYDDLHIKDVKARLKRGNLPSSELVKEVVKRKGKDWLIVEPRFQVPSVWELKTINIK